MQDIFTVIVMSTSDEGCFTETPIESVVVVLAATSTEATLIALEIVACRRCPVSADVDWSNF